MNDKLNLTFFVAAGSFMASMLGYYFLLRIKRTEKGFLKRVFYVPARKSSTDAIQFGGIPLALSVIASSIFVFYWDVTSHEFGFSFPVRKMLLAFFRH